MSRRMQMIQDEGGSTIVEFAIIAPVMLLMIGGLLELGYVAFARSTLESAILDASRKAKVADCPNQVQPLIQQELNSRMSVITSADATPPTLDVRSYGGLFSNVGNPEPLTEDLNGNKKWDDGDTYIEMNGEPGWQSDMGRKGNYGSYGDVVQFSATYNVISLLPFIAAQINNGNNYYTISAVTVVRNEPYRNVTC